jgi:hypothetical protein
LEGATVTEEEKLEQFVAAAGKSGVVLVGSAVMKAMMEQTGTTSGMLRLNGVKVVESPYLNPNDMMAMPKQMPMYDSFHEVE